MTSGLIRRIAKYHRQREFRNAIGDEKLRRGRPVGAQLADAGVARIPAEVFEHRHARTANPAIVSAHAKLEQFNHAIHFAKRRTHHGKVELLNW